ncbi:MAG TPA: AIPR family protein, partial [Segetibacter sp.]
RNALNYLLGESKLVPNDKVRYLYNLIADDRGHDDFSLTFFLIVYGRLDSRAVDSFQELKAKYEHRQVRLILQEIPELVDEFLIGSSRATDEINVELRTASGSILRYRDYCYFLANASDLYRAFQQYGWRLFDLNLRYEVRNSSVNGDIVDSLSYHKSRKNFHHYNNGLIIITKRNVLPKGDTKVRLVGAQIVNGLQTVKSIYNAVSMKQVTPQELDEDCVVQVKAISTGEPEFTSQVVQSTNNQNPMAPRNLRANNREQKILRTGFASLTPRWFLQVKEGEWESLTQEGGRFFKQVVGYPTSEFKPDAQKRKGRVIDNQEAAKSWLAFIGFADMAGDRTSHYFALQEVYDMAFQMRPSSEHWMRFADAIDFDTNRRVTLERQQGGAQQYLLAFLLWQFTRSFIPSPPQYRREALEEGVKASKIRKSSGEIISSDSEQNTYLADNMTYQTWRLMTNMKELVVEVASQILCKKYGPLDPSTCLHLIQNSEVNGFLTTGEIREIAQAASKNSDLPTGSIFSRVFGLIRYASS